MGIKKDFQTAAFAAVQKSCYPAGGIHRQIPKGIEMLTTNFNYSLL